MRTNKTMKFMVVIALILTLFMSMTMTFTSHAEETDSEVVRVGWYDSSFCTWDEFGRRSGIDFEYQQKISAYTGWKYEYVEDSWPNLLQMLIDGEIDLLSDVSYKPERADKMLFPDLPMGSESYYIYIDSVNREIIANDLATFNGKRIGVNRNSVQEEFLYEWAERYGIDIEVIPLDTREGESMELLKNGEIDGYATVFTFDSAWDSVPVCRIGGSDYYYAVNKDRPDLLAELNMALAGIRDEDPYFTQKINEEKYYNTRTTTFLTAEEEDWITEHGTVRIGYQDNYLPFCASDKETGELTGALKDYLAHAANNLQDSGIQFEAIPYPTTEDALRAMKIGEIDCVFPVNLSAYDANEMDVRLTNPAMKTEMNAIVREEDSQDLHLSGLNFAVPAGSPNIVTFIMDNFPEWRWKLYKDDYACFEAVTSRDADSLLVSNYRLPTFEDIMNKYKLFSVPTGESLPFSFAVNKDDPELYFILNKTVVMTKSEDMDAALASYMKTSQKVTFTQFIKDNWIIVLAVISAVFFLIVILLLLRLKAVRKINEQQQMMQAVLKRELEQQEQLQSAMKLAYKDPLTGVKSKRAYNEAEENMDQRIENGEAVKFSVAVFDLNDLKMINDTKGHETGDEYIKDACKQICTCFEHSPVYRIGGDEFAAILQGDDYSNQDALMEQFKTQMLGVQDKNGVIVASGCARFDPKKDQSFRTVFERADALMYEDKKRLKDLETGSRQSAE